jgi:hypothetical protein
MQKELEVVFVCSGLEHQLVCDLSSRGRFVVEKKKVFSLFMLQGLTAACLV